MVIFSEVLAFLECGGSSPAISGEWEIWWVAASTESVPVVVVGVV